MTKTGFQIIKRAEDIISALSGEAPESDSESDEDSTIDDLIEAIEVVETAGEAVLSLDRYTELQKLLGEILDVTEGTLEEEAPLAIPALDAEKLSQLENDPEFISKVAAYEKTGRDLSREISAADVAVDNIWTRVRVGTQ